MVKPRVANLKGQKWRLRPNAKNGDQGQTPINEEQVISNAKVKSPIKQYDIS